MKLAKLTLKKHKKTLPEVCLHTNSHFLSKSITKTHRNNSDVFSSLDKFQERYAFGMKSSFIPVLKEFINRTGKYKNTHFKEIAGDGGLSIVFDIGNNEVLKFTKENPYEFRKHFPILDIPLIEMDKYNDFYLVREVKAKTTGLNNLHMKLILKKMKACKLEPSRDFCIEQIGLYGNEPLLLDTRCAMPKPDKFSRFVYDFQKRYKKHIQIKVPDFNAPLTHIDETPRPNLSLKQGTSIIIATIKENIRYFSRFINS